MHKREMRIGMKCYVSGFIINEDGGKIPVNSKAKIYEEPYLSTVKVKLENPPSGISEIANISIHDVYWTKQD